MEIWKDIVGYEDKYQISNQGNVKSIVYNKERILKPSVNTKGYYHITLRKENKSTTTKIHQLVAIAFLNHIPNGNKIVVDHINCDKLNNNIDNLQLITNRENCSKDKKGGSSKYVGVSFYKQTGKWVANIWLDGKQHHLGYFTQEYYAFLAYHRKLKNIKINKIYETIN